MKNTKIINQQIIKNSNLKKVYNCVYDDNGISRAKIARMLGLSKTTISSLVEELICNHVIYDKGTDTSGKLNVGRNPSCLMPVKNYNYVAVALWKPNLVSMKLIDINGGTAVTLDEKVDNIESYVNETRDCFDQLLKKIDKNKIFGVCVIIPGMVDPNREEIIATPIGILKSSGANVIKSLKDRFTDIPISIFNDTACLTYAEMISSKIKDVDFAFINFEKGIGASLYIQKKILGGATGTFTQFGHYSLDPDGVACKCGGRGCLEVMIGENSIVDRINKISDKKCLNDANDLKSINSITYKDLNEAAMKENAAATIIIRDIAFDFSKAVVNLISVVRPKLIIIGGRGKDLGELFLDNVKDNLKHMGFRYIVDTVNVIYSKSESNDCYAGAARYFIDEYYDFAQSMQKTVNIG